MKKRLLFLGKGKPDEVLEQIKELIKKEYGDN